MLYSAIVKKRIRQAFDDVNNRRWDQLMTTIAPRVLHRFGGAHAIGEAMRWIRDDMAGIKFAIEFYGVDYVMYVKRPPN